MREVINAQQSAHISSPGQAFFPLFISFSSPTRAHLATMSEYTHDAKPSLSEAERGHDPKADQFHKQDDELAALGYKGELNRNRSLYTILFQVLAITAVPFGEGTALTSAIYGGGQLAYFVGWVVVVFLDECVAVSLAELASKFPTSSGPP